MKTVLSNELLIAQCKSLEDTTKKDVTTWFEIYKLIYLGVSLVDRTNNIKFPYKFYNYFPLPTNLKNFNKSYSDICLDRAKDLLTLSRSLKKPIMVFWSGGIDSTVVLISLILAGAKEEIIVSLNPLSIMENPQFYYNHIRGKFKIISSEKICDLLNGNYILLGGEHNDQLFGSDLLGMASKAYGFELLFENYNEKNIMNLFCLRKMKPEYGYEWFCLLDEHAKNAPCEIKTVYDFFWWFNFVFKWQSVYFRLATRINPMFRHTINEKFMKDYYHQFFVTEDFQKWAMLNPDKKIKKTWESYKVAAKEFIFSYDKNKNYYDHKVKRGSLSKIFQHRIVPEGLTKNYQYIDYLDKTQFYESNNTFN